MILPLASVPTGTRVPTTSTWPGASSTAIAPVARAGSAFVPRWALACGVGLTVGALTSPAQTMLGSTVWSGLTNAVGPWLLAPFLVAAWATTVRSAAWTGVLASVLQVAGYYAVAAARSFPINDLHVAEWLAAGVVGGVVLGVAGWSWRHGRWRGAGLAVLVAAWVVEAVVVFGLALGHTGQAVVAGAMGLLFFAVLGRHRHQHRSTALWLLPAVAAGALGFGSLLVLM